VGEAKWYRIVETDNFGGDYPDESFHGPPMSKERCRAAAAIFNGPKDVALDAPRYYKVVALPYTLQPGFEP
jgi:hypothetical protein